MGGVGDTTPPEASRDLPRLLAGHHEGLDRLNQWSREWHLLEALP